jgi:hypothetical protein
MNTTTSKVFMIREGRNVMTVYNNKRIPHVIGFKNYKDAERTVFHIDTRDTEVYQKMINNQLEIIKKTNVQFGNLQIDEVELHKFAEYALRPQNPNLTIVNELKNNNDKHLLFDCEVLENTID